MAIVGRAALLFACLLALTASAQQPELTAAQITERLSEWDQGYARLRRSIWNVQRGTTMYGRDFRGRTVSDDLRDFALTKSVEQRLTEQRKLIDSQLAKGDTRLATETLLSMYRDLRDELESLERLSGHRIRHRQVAQQHALWQQLATSVANYQVPEAIRTLEQQAVEQLNAGRFEQAANTTYPALLQEYARERERLFKSGARISATSGKRLFYERRSPCGASAVTNTGKPIPTLASTTQPEYPATSRRANEEGTVYVQLLAGRSGCALRYAIEFSSGWPDLDDAALDWAETVTFVPAAKDGNAIDTWVTMPVTFRLND